MADIRLAPLSLKPSTHLSVDRAPDQHIVTILKTTGQAAVVPPDKASLDIFWLKDDNLDDLPPPDVLQQEIIDHLEAALASFRDVAAGLAR